MTMPSTAASLSALARLALRRTFRRRALWIALAIAALPTVFAAAERGRSVISGLDDTFLVARLLLAILPALLVGAAIGEDIEDRTATYLWSRPLARWTMVAGKLLALAPIAIAVVCASWVVASLAVFSGAQLAMPTLALALGALGCSAIAAAIAVLVPKHGMSLAIVYVMFDLMIGSLPTSLAKLSICNHVFAIANRHSDATDVAEAAIAIVVISGVWLAVGLRRIRHVEV